SPKRVTSLLPARNVQERRAEHDGLTRRKARHRMGAGVNLHTSTLLASAPAPPAGGIGYDRENPSDRRPLEDGSSLSSGLARITKGKLLFTRSPTSLFVALLAAPLVCAQPDAPQPHSALPGRAGLPAVLVFSRTAGYRHDSIETGVAMLRELGAA